MNGDEKMTTAEGVASIIFDYRWEDGERPDEADCMELGRKILSYMTGDRDSNHNHSEGR